MKNFIEWVLRQRIAIIVLTLLITAAAAYQAKNLRIVIDDKNMLPQTHPYIATSNQVEKVFGTRYIVVIGITTKLGDVYQPAVLEKVKRITARLSNAPGVIKHSLISFSAHRAKQIVGTDYGMEVKPLMETIPTTPEDFSALQKAIEKNPVYINSIVSKDAKTTSIVVEFKDDPKGNRAVMERIEKSVAPERDANTEIAFGGWPPIGAMIEIYSERMVLLLPIAILVLSLVLFEAFRSKQGPILPLLTGVIAVIWGVGVMGASGIPMDVFNATTPIVILSVATGHAVQMLKRYYEDYYRLREKGVLTAHEANHAAVVSSLVRVGPVMLIAGSVASLGLLSLLVVNISTVRTFGVFTAIGIMAATIVELTFIPAVRSILSPPNDLEWKRKQRMRFWDKLTNGIGNLVAGSNSNRNRVYGGLLLFVIVALIGMTKIHVDNSSPSYFAPDQKVITDDIKLNKQLGGTRVAYFLVEGGEADAIKNPKLLQAMDDLQRFIEEQPHVGKTVSIVDFIKRMNRAMHADDPAFFTVPKNQELVSQYLLLYSMSGEPDDFDTYVDNDYRQANISGFIKSESSAEFAVLVEKVQAFAAARFPHGVKLKIGGGLANGAALNEVMVKAKILNIVQITVVVLLISSLIFRSFVAGLLVISPLLLTTLANFGLIGWSGIPLNISTSLTSSMAVGIGVDYAIYLIFRIREELENGTDERTAIRKVLMSAGQAILFVALAVAAGYGVLLLSFGFRIHQWMAVLIATAMLVSAFSTLLLIPALILTFRPNFIFNRGLKKMKTVFASTAMLAVLCSGMMQSHRAIAADINLDDIMAKNAMVSKVVDSTFNATFTLINKDGQERIRKTYGTTKLAGNGTDNMRMTRFLAPADVKGTVSLLMEHSEKNDDIWIYLPALKKVRRLVASNKKDSFVGTDFSNADVLGKDSDWKYKLLREEVQDGQACYVVEALPKSETVKTNTGYSRRVMWVRKDNLASVQGEYWDESGALLKTAKFTDIQLVDAKRGKWQAMRLEANNVQTGHRTIIRFENFKVNQHLEDDFFTARYMEKE
jgi:predicted RND superfamily exporter protein/outer membrane lipoprotein-sorting protein